MLIKNVYTSNRQKWFSCTCSDTTLFASTNQWGSFIMEFSLVPKIDLIKEWRSTVICSKDQVISDTVYSDGKLALIIIDRSNKSVHMELRSTTTFNRIWLLQLDIRWIHNTVFRCSSLSSNEWLIIDRSSDHLLQVSKDGRIKKTLQYYPSPHHAILLDKTRLLISVENRVNLHVLC